MKVVNDSNLPTVAIKDVSPTQGNLKDLTDKNYEKLKKLIEKRGFYLPIYVWIDKDGKKYLLDGHQRQRVLINEGWGDEPIPYFTIPATDVKEAAERLLEITSQFGTITQEGIDEYMAQYDLLEADVYESTQFDAIYGWGDQSEEEEIDESPYTGKIDTPDYEPKGEKPDVSELYNKTKTEQLIEEIKEAKVSPVIKEFLLASAQRHTAFNYANIAEFYAHQPKEIQELMEKSALVIVDYEDAIKNGFIKLSEEIAEQYVGDKE